MTKISLDAKTSAVAFVATMLVGCGGDSTVSPPMITVTTPPAIVAPITPSVTLQPVTGPMFIAPQKISGISITEKTTLTADGKWLFDFSLGGGFYFANGVLSVLPIFYPTNAVNADPTLLGKNTNVYLSEFTYTLNGLTATPTTPVAKVSSPGSGSNGLVMADFNGDGIQDVFIGDSGYDAEPSPGGQNSLLFGKSGGGFTTGKLPIALDFTHSVAAADIDNDGDVDIFVGNIGWAPYFLMNDGKGNFTQDFNLLSGLPINKHSYTGSYIGDVNKDGKIDIILSGNGIGSELLSWDGRKFVVEQHLYLNDNIGRVTTSVKIADFNNDGKNEIILHSTNQSSTNFYDQDRIDVLIEGAYGKYQTSQSILISPKAWNQNLYVEDVNSDGWLDMVSLGFDSKILLNDKGKLFVSEYKLPFDSSTTQASAMLDINTDGKLDILFTKFDEAASAPGRHVETVYVMFAQR